MADVREEIESPLEQVLEILDEAGTLTEAEARLYFQIERYLFPANEMFRPENLEATERQYLARANG